MATIELRDVILSNVSDAPGGLTSSKVLGVGSDGNLYRFPTTQPGNVVAQAKATATSFALSEIVAGAGIFYTQLPGNCVWMLPTMADLGFTWTANKWLAIPMMQLGLGTIQCNPAQCRSPAGGGTSAQMLALIGCKAGDYFIRNDTTPTGTVCIYNGGTISDPNSWLKTVLASASNCPTAAGIVINDPKGLSASNLVQYESTLLVSTGLDSWTYI